MRGECKYAHWINYQRYIDGTMRDVTVNECWAEKEPIECNDKNKETCEKYKPISDNNLRWIDEKIFNTITAPYVKCARCGYGNTIDYIRDGGALNLNYCPHCGYEYEPWDGTTFK